MVQDHLCGDALWKGTDISQPARGQVSEHSPYGAAIRDAPEDVRSVLLDGPLFPAEATLPVQNEGQLGRDVVYLPVEVEEIKIGRVYDVVWVAHGGGPCSLLILFLSL